MTTLEAVQQFFVTHRGESAAALPPADASLFESGLLDSLGMLEFVDYLQDTFGVELTEDDVTLEHFASMATVSALVDTKRASR